MMHERRKLTAVIGCLLMQVLAKKVYTLYSLAVQQLSKQDHYDFGLRALVSVLRYAGRKKRSNPNMTDEEVSIIYTNT
jgi:dynein heavy chain